jgi:hypothetical protein
LTKTRRPLDEDDARSLGVSSDKTEVIAAWDGQGERFGCKRKGRERFPSNLCRDFGLAGNGLVVISLISPISESGEQLPPLALAPTPWSAST